MTARQHDGTAATTAAPDCAGRNGAHTPGPWLPEWELSRGTFCQVAAFSTEGNRILRCAIESFRPVDDARLIAAAPDLLEALREAESVVDALDRSGYSQGDVLAAIRAAIAKAEGC